MTKKSRKSIHKPNYFTSFDKKLLLPLLSFILLSIVFVNTHLYWLTFIALMPFIKFCLQAHAYSRRQLISSITLAGFVFSLGIFAWELQTSPNSWTSLQGGLAIFSKILVWLLCSMFASLGFWMLAHIINFLKSQPKLLLICLPAAWVVCEFIRVYAFSFLSYGPGGSFSPNWNLGIAGLGLIPTPLGFLSRFVGLYGMSMVVVAINIVLYLAFFKRKIALAVYTIILLLVLSFISYRVFLPNGKIIKVASAHLETLDSLDSWDNLEKPSKDTDIIIVPEYSLFFNNKQYHQFVEDNMSKDSTLITSVATETQPSENLLTYYSPNQGVFSQQPKTFLISSGEYMPYVLAGFFKLINQEHLITSFNDAQQIKRGNNPEHTVQTPKAKVGALVCSGVLALNQYRGLANNDAEILTNSASLSLIANASMYHVQERYLTRFHALANARPFVQSSRSGQSYVMNSNGNILSQANGYSKLITSDVQLSSRKTIYTIIGEWTVVLSFIILSVVCFRKSKEIS